MKQSRASHLQDKGCMGPDIMPEQEYNNISTHMAHMAHRRCKSNKQWKIFFLSFNSFDNFEQPVMSRVAMLLNSR